MRATQLLGGIAVFGLVFAGGLAAQAAAPKDATGQCTDGSFTTAKTQEKGCLKHGGVKAWFGSPGATATAPAAAPAAKASAPEAAPASAERVTSLASTRAAPKDATGQCTDGSYTTAKTQEKGCLKHGGVKTWFGSMAAVNPAMAPAPAVAPTKAAPATVAPSSVPAAAPAPVPTARPTTTAQGPVSRSDVWVNLSTKAYHCPGTKYYGTTKHGKYMSEADAKAAGFHPSYGKVCS